MINIEKYTPIISVIVPVYNTEKYLVRCIESILSQNFSNFELLLIDDGSQDSSGRICDQYAKIDIRIKVYHKKMKGSVQQGILDCVLLVGIGSLFVIQMIM